ncbi:MAG: hypothetical protein L6Q46_05005 [Flavobacterium sp.]|uniref:hypothetical protein n=1 Tax=Flavobacterium sp. TaxID=239 RepID=UPI0025C56F45|nr:hypothetical protein [Flavobacterium sp.]MCK6607649.1 hypothetical protein [Flavobacterium sp.]
MARKIIMLLSSVTLGISGIILSFALNLLLNLLNIRISDNVMTLIQILGALYFSFGVLNWMAKSSLVGGIYNRPIVLANLAHHFIGGLALLKGQLFKTDASYVIWVLGMLYFFLLSPSGIC